jgi:hypothetical protein
LKLAACVLTLVVLSGCSGGNDGDTASATAPPSTATGGTVTTVRPVDTSFTGQNSAQFCNLAKTYSDRFTSVGSNPTPAQLRTVSREGQTAITQAVDAAPSEIKKDVEVIASTFGGLIAELEKVNFEASRVPPASLSALSAPEFTAATTRFQAYVRQVCGVS